MSRPATPSHPSPRTRDRTRRASVPDPREGRWPIRPAHPWAAAATLILSLAILAVDLSVPQGVAVSALYCAPILASVSLRNLTVTVAMVVVLSLAIALGWQVSDGGSLAGVVVLNRSLCVSVVWLCGAMVASRLLASERFRAAVEASPACMIVADRRGRIEFANPEAARMLGVQGPALLGAPLERHFPLGEGTGRVELSHGASELACRRGDGSRFDAMVAVRPIRTELGPMLLVTARDLTEERRKHEADVRLATIVRSSRDAMFAKRLDGTITDWNPGAERIYGYSAEEIVGRNVSVLVPTDLQDQLQEILATLRRGETVSKLGTRRRTKDGRIIDVDLVVSPIHDRRGRIVGASSVARNVTTERESERLMLELNTALNLAVPGLATVDKEGRLEKVNDAAGNLTRCAPRDLVGESWLELLDVDSHDAAQAALERMLREGRSELTARAGSPDEHFLELFLVRRLDSSGCFTGFHAFLRDVSERVRTEVAVRELADGLADANLKLQRLVHVDPLTGLMNRRGLERHVRRMRSDARRHDAPTAVILVDIDDFKRINSVHGHAGGDRILANVGQALERGSRPSDCVARIGGDEFLLVLPDTSLGEAAMIAERLRRAVARTKVPGPDGEISVTCSFGVAVVRGAVTAVESLIAAARSEFSRSKEQGKDRVSASAAPPTENALLDELLSGRGLRAVHQPIYDLLERRVVAVELMTRGPRGRYESPKVFLDLPHPGERSTMLDLACLRTCLRAASRLPEGLCAHVNLFPSTLIGLGADQVLEELQEAGPGRLLCVELNERDIPGSSELLRSHVRDLRAAGVQVAIDDVGFGRTSLEALIYLEPDVIKLDQACVGPATDARALERLLTVATVLRARVIAEGVEDAAVLERLLALRVRYGQGHLWGRPAPVGRLDEGVLWPAPRGTAESMTKRPFVERAR